MGAISLAQAVRNALETERGAARFYRDLANRTEHPDARAFLFKMAEQEDHHAESLDALGRAFLWLPEHADALVEVVETAPTWADASGLDLDEALLLADEAEARATRYYRAMAAVTTGIVADFFTRLADMEEGHVDAVVKLRDRQR